MENHLFLSPLMLVVLGAMLGILGVYLTQLLMALWEITKVLYWFLTLGGNYG
jgi:hypothetical protein